MPRGLLDDSAALVAIGATLAVLAVVAHTLRPDVPVPRGVPPWVAMVLALALTAAPARFARLAFLDTAHGQPSSLRQGFVAGVTILILTFGAGFLARGWPSLTSVPLGVQVVGWIVAAVLLQTAWFWALRRHHAHADLAA